MKQLDVARLHEAERTTTPDRSEELLNMFQRMFGDLRRAEDGRHDEMMRSMVGPHDTQEAILQQRVCSTRLAGMQRSWAEA